MKVLGISPLDKDSTVTIVEDGVIAYAAAEERFTRVKLQDGFPWRALQAGLELTGIEPADIDVVAYPFFTWEEETAMFRRNLDANHRLLDLIFPSLEVPLHDEQKKAREPLVVRKAGTGQHATKFRADREGVDRNHGREDRGFSARFMRLIPRFYPLRLAGGDETSDRAPSMACRCTGTKCQALRRS